MKPPVYNPDWHEEVKALYRHDMQEIWDRTISRQVWNQYHNQLDLYHQIAGEASPGEAKKILDVGCAQGTLALLLAERGHRVYAIDLRPHFLEYAKSRYVHGDIQFVEGNALELDLDEHFDLIFANQIIEHLVYPRILVRRLRSLLAAGGQLVVTTPNWHYFINKTLPSYKELGDPAQHEHRQFTADGDGHFFAYRADELVEVFREEGLVDVQFRYFETPFISGHLKVRYLHRLVPIGLLRSLDRLVLAIPGLSRALAHQLLVIGCNP
jgi:2-polyprenyl-3-methyl-5-hydroxy-6-metoxy-1,4-benzoquinol methylase